MGKKRARTKRTKTKHTHSRTIWKGVEREVKRQEIDKANQEAASKADPSVQDTRGIEAIQNQKSTAIYNIVVPELRFGRFAFCVLRSAFQNATHGSAF